MYKPRSVEGNTIVADDASRDMDADNEHSADTSDDIPNRDDDTGKLCGYQAHNTSSRLDHNRSKLNVAVEYNGDDKLPDAPDPRSTRHLHRQLLLHIQYHVVPGQTGYNSR